MQSLKSIDFPGIQQFTGKGSKFGVYEPIPRPIHLNLHKGKYTKYQTGIFWLVPVVCFTKIATSYRTWPCFNCWVTLRTNLCQGRDKIELPKHSISSLTSVPIQAETRPPCNTKSTFTFIQFT